MRLIEQLISSQLLLAGCAVRSNLAPNPPGFVHVYPGNATVAAPGAVHEVVSAI